MKEIKVGLGTCGISAGGQPVYDVLKQEIDDKKTDVVLKETGCMGMCYEEPLVEVVENGKSHLYSHVTPDKARRIFAEHILEDKPVEDWIVKSDTVKDSDTFFAKQKRIVLRNCGVIDPGSIDEYIAHDGYKAIKKAIDEYSPEQVIDIITSSGLRGRGGGGFSTGMKWKFARQATGDKSM